MKKKILLFAAAFILMSVSFTSCQKDCQYCKIVTREANGTEVSSTGETQYCDLALSSFKLANPTVTNPVTGRITKVECR
ncbi:MAG: hypothetical protein U0X39_15480 [Bacteroidales bacterium]